MLVKGHKLAKCFRCETLDKDGVRRAVALENPVGDELIRSAFSLDLLARFAEGQCLGLCENICQQHVVMPAKRIQWLAERDEVAWDEPGPLVNELIERVVAVGSRLAPVNRSGLIANLGAGQRDVFAVALHGQLLEISGKSFQVLFVGQYRNRFRAKEVAVPDTQEPH